MRRCEADRSPISASTVYVMLDSYPLSGLVGCRIVLARMMMGAPWSHAYMVARGLDQYVQVCGSSSLLAMGNLCELYESGGRLMWCGCCLAEGIRNVGSIWVSICNVGSPRVS